MASSADNKKRNIVENFKAMRDRAEIAVERIDHVKQKGASLNQDVEQKIASLEAKLKSLLFENPQDKFPLDIKDSKIKKQASEAYRELREQVKAVVEILVDLNQNKIDVVIPQPLQEFVKGVAPRTPESTELELKSTTTGNASDKEKKEDSKDEDERKKLDGYEEKYQKLKSSGALEKVSNLEKNNTDVWIKRTSGEWQQGKIVDVPGTVVVVAFSDKDEVKKEKRISIEEFLKWQEQHQTPEPTPEPTPPVIDVVDPSVKAAEEGEEKKKEEKEKKEKRKIIDIPGSVFGEILEKHRKTIKKAEKLMVHTETIGEARILIDGIFAHANQKELSEKLATYGFELADFLKSWKENWAEHFFDALHTDIEYERVKAMEATKTRLGSALDWAKSNFNLDRVKQVGARVGMVAGVGALFGLGVGAAGLGTVGVGITGGAVGFTRFAQDGFKKSKKWFGELDKAAAETTAHAREEVYEERLHGKKTTEKLLERLDDRGYDHMFGLLSGVVRQSSFELINVEAEKEKKSEMKFANQALLQATYLERIIEEKKQSLEKLSESEIDASLLVQEQAELQEKRMDHLLISLYADDSKKFINALATALEKQPGLVKVLEKINAFKNANLEQLIKSAKNTKAEAKVVEPKKAEAKASGHSGGHGGHGSHGHSGDHGHSKHSESHDEGGDGHSRLVNALNGIFYTAGGATIATAIAAQPGTVKAILMGVWGAYEGAKYEVRAERHKKEKQFEKAIVDIIGNAERALLDAEKRTSSSKKGISIHGKNTEEYRKWAEQLRMALNFGTLEKVEKIKDGHHGEMEKKTRTMLWYRAHAVLRGLEKELYEAPTEIKDARMDALLDVLSEDFEHQVETQGHKLEDIKKTNKLRLIGRATLGFIGGAVGGYALGMWRSHGHTSGADAHHTSAESALVSHANTHDMSLHPEAAVAGGGAASASIVHETASSHVSSGIGEHRIETGESTHSFIGRVEKGEGVLHAANKALVEAKSAIPELAAMNENQIRAWKIDELKRLGFVFENGKWGYPFTVHVGAEVGIVVDEHGHAHMKLIGDEGKEYTMNKFYKFKEAGHGSVEVPHELQQEIAGARHNTEQLVGEINEGTKVGSTSHPSLVIDKDLAQEIKVGGQIPGVLEAHPAYDGTALKLTLEGGKVAYAYPVPGADLELGTHSGQDRFYWKLETVEHSPLFRLPGEIEAGSGSHKLITSDTLVHKSDAIVSKSEYEKLGSTHQSSQVQEVAKHSEPVKQESKVTEPSAPQKEVNNTNPEMLMKKEEYSAALTRLEQLKDKIQKIVNLEPDRKTRILASFNEWINDEKAQINNPKSVLPTNPEEYVDRLQSDLWDKSAELSVFSQGFSETTPIFTDSEHGVTGQAIVGNVEYAGDRSISFIRFRPMNSSKEFMYMAPPGYEFGVQGAKVVLEDVETGEPVPYEFSQVDYTLTETKVIPVLAGKEGAPTQTTEK